MTVHIPVLGMPVTALLMAIAVWKKSDLLWSVGVWFLFGVTLLGGIAYLSGPAAYEVLDEWNFLPWVEGPEETKGLIEDHAAVAKGVYFTSLIPAVMALAQFIRVLGGDSWPKWMKITLPVLLILLSVGFAYTAHLGGMIRHPEIYRSAPLLDLS
ncbi:hypothetical protein [Stratiformator vulcanicus]|nr:hypothetical protein [Stratiformator vulcanicus]